MGSLRWTVRAALLALSMGGSALGAQTATQTVRFEVRGINRATVATMAAPLAVRPTAASVGTGRWALTTSQPNQKVTASLDRPMPSGVMLTVALGAPAGASSHGPQMLDVHGADVVTGIPASTSDSLPVAYTMSTAGARAAAPGEQRIVTYTIVEGP